MGLFGVVRRDLRGVGPPKGRRLRWSPSMWARGRWCRDRSNLAGGRSVFLLCFGQGRYTNLPRPHKDPDIRSPRRHWRPLPGATSIDAVHSCLPLPPSPFPCHTVPLCGPSRQKCDTCRGSHRGPLAKTCFASHFRPLRSFPCRSCPCLFLSLAFPLDLACTSSHSPSAKACRPVLSSWRLTRSSR